MNLNSINNDVKKLESALKLIEKTENHLHFNKSVLMVEICKQINVLKDKAEKQTNFINSLN